MLKAVSSAVRFNILSLLFDKGSMSYTELMNRLKMNPSRDAGRFAYHLKFLLKADLIEVDVESKKYKLTELGKIVVNIAEEIEKKGLKPQRLLVRTSRYALEEFDVNKIAESLIKEAGMSAELAQKVAKEAEKRLLKAKASYLTAPLIREVVNAILIEKGLEEYRHKLTRLGLPVHDVSALLTKIRNSLSSPLEEAGRSVFEEYTLLNVFPRDISDAYLSGALHIHGLGGWILRPSEVIHDLRLFLKNGLCFEGPNTLSLSYPPPKNFEAALLLAFNVFLHSRREVDGTQTFEYFNIFLAPFFRGVEEGRAKEALKLFILNLSHHGDVSLNIEPTIPEFLAETPTAGSSKEGECYGSFVEESQIIASLILEVLAEESQHKPVQNPKIIVKVRPEVFNDNRAEKILIQAHRLASEGGAVNFASPFGDSGKNSTFLVSGCKIDADWSGDWEIDTIRTGILGCVTINVPRIAYESEGNQSKYFEILKDRLEMAAKALQIKRKALRVWSQNLLPFLFQKINGDSYFRLESSPMVINFAGLKEASQTLVGSVYDDESTLKFTFETLKEASDFAIKTVKRNEERLLLSALPSPEAAQRLAKFDIERYGVSKVRFLGTRETPWYSTYRRVSLQEVESLSKILALEREADKLLNGGSLAVLELGQDSYEPLRLLEISRKLIKEYGIRFFTYDQSLTYCITCNKTWKGLLHKCPSCGAVNALTHFKRYL